MNKKFADFVELDEGINDPGIFKAVFLAGGPGSGKSFIVGQTALTAFGLKLVNSDIAFETALKKAGLEATPENIFTTKGQSLRDRAKKLTKARQAGYIDGRLGLIIDGTGKDYNKIAAQKKALEEIGYDCAMIFVNTSEKTAQSRNQDRERTMPQAQVAAMWQRVQNNIGKFQNLFGAGTFHIVDNNTESNYKGATLDVYRKIGAWTRTHPRNYKAARWIKSQKLARSNETKSRLRESIDPVKEYGPTFVASAKQLAKQRKLTKELGVKLADVTKSLGHPVAAGGLTSVALARLPAEVKSNPKWKAADKAIDVSFEKELQMNLLMLKTFNIQMRDFMNRDRRSYMALFEEREESYKDKFEAMLKKSGKTLADMSDEEKKEFFAKVDAGHDAKNEETQRGISFVDHALEEGVSTLSPEEESEAAPQLAEVVEEDDVQEDVKPFDKNARLHMIKTAARNVAKKSAAAAVRAAKSDYKQSSKRGLAPVKYDESFDYDSLTVESVEELSKTQAYRLIDAINKKINLGE